MRPAPGKKAAVYYPGLTALDYMADEEDLRIVRRPTPEKRLVAAVFAEAIEDLKKGPGADTFAETIYRDTRAWVASDDLSWPYGFVPLCHELDLDVETTREAVLAIVPSANHRRGVLTRPHGVDPRPSIQREYSNRPMWGWRYGSNR